MNDVVMPFQRERDPIVKVAFKPISWLKKVDFVKRLVLDNNVLISLLGEEESGKTTFANLLRSLPSSQIHTHMLMANPRFNRAVILKEITKLLKFDGDVSIENVVENCQRQKSHYLLMIDDAHYLSVDFIEELLSELKKQGNKAYFHVMLISDYSVVAALNTFAQETYKDMIHSIEVPPLTESETKTFVLQHMPFLIGPGKKINDERFKQFFQITQGHVVEINREMGKFFYDAASHPIHKKRSLFYPLSMAAVFGIIALASIFVWDLAQDFFTVAPQELTNPLPPRVVTSILPSPEKRLLMNSQIPAYTLSATRQLVTTLIRMSDLVDPEADAVNEPMAVIDKVIVAPKVIEKSSIAALKEQAKNSKTNLTKVSESASLLKNKKNYTVQLLASHSREKLSQFLKQHPLNQKTQIIQTVHQGSDWYILILGEFTQYQMAKQAINALPKNVAQFKPWIRRVSELKPLATG
jgi:DamX protein